MKTNRSRWTTRAAPALLLVAVLGAGRARADAPCLEDAAKVCPGIPMGDGRLWACLQRNSFQVSSACQRNLQEIQRRAAELDADCGADVYRFCPSTPRGKFRILQCLAVHVGRRELSSNCEGAVTTAIEKLDEFAVACANEAETLCPGVQAGDGKLLVCLRAQSDRLSSRCKRAVSP